MKKVSFLIRDLNYGGAQRQLVTLAKSLAKNGFDVAVLYFYPNGPLVKELEACGVPTICLEKRGRWHLLSFFWHLIRELKRLNPDILHGYLGESNLLTILLKPFFPSTLMIWGLREANVVPSLYGWLGNLLFQLERVLSRFADLIIINSEAGKVHHLAYGYPGNKMIVIPNGIDVEYFQPDLEARTKTRIEWKIPENIILIGIVGRLDPRKDHPTFLKTASLLCQERKDIRFICIGNGPENYAQKLHQIAGNLGIAENLIWAGSRTDMAAVYSALDVLVSSSYTEGFPNVVGEAMACGVPCVVTDVGDSARIVGDASVVAPPNDPEALKIVLTKLIEKLDTPDFDRSKIRQRVIDLFSVRQLALMTEAVLLKPYHGPISY